MCKYNILRSGIDFDFSFNDIVVLKGTREKRIVIDSRTGEKAYFKYEKYNCSEACSEKMCYEIAKVLDYPCAHIELGLDENGNIGILNYLFIDKMKSEHTDAISYINKNSKERKEFYTIENIKKCLDEISSNLFEVFLRIMVFDALVGETDRHEENWGITKIGNDYQISPLYDNGCNLLRDFKNLDLAMKYYDGKKNFKDYIKRPKSLIYKDDHSKKYNLIELIEELYKKYPLIIGTEIKNLSKLTDDKILEIVNKIPDELLTNKHKEYIITFLKERKRMLTDIIKNIEKSDEDAY